MITAVDFEAPDFHLADYLELIRVSSCEVMLFDPTGPVLPDATPLERHARLLHDKLGVTTATEAAHLNADMVRRLGLPAEERQAILFQLDGLRAGERMLRVREDGQLATDETWFQVYPQRVPLVALTYSFTKVSPQLSAILQLVACWLATPPSLVPSPAGAAKSPTGTASAHATTEVLSSIGAHLEAAAFRGQTSRQPAASSTAMSPAIPTKDMAVAASFLRPIIPNHKSLKPLALATAAPMSYCDYQHFPVMRPLYAQFIQAVKEHARDHLAKVAKVEEAEEKGRMQQLFMAEWTLSSDRDYHHLEGRLENFVYHYLWRQDMDYGKSRPDLMGGFAAVYRDRGTAVAGARDMVTLVSFSKQSVCYELQYAYVIYAIKTVMAASKKFNLRGELRREFDAMFLSLLVDRTTDDVATHIVSLWLRFRVSLERVRNVLLDCMHLCDPGNPDLSFMLLVARIMKTLRDTLSSAGSWNVSLVVDAEGLITLALDPNQNAGEPGQPTICVAPVTHALLLYKDRSLMPCDAYVDVVDPLDLSHVLHQQLMSVTAAF